MKSAVGRDIPTAAAGYGPVAAFAGAFQTTQPLRRYAPLMKQARPGDDKVLDSLAEAFQRIPVKDGMTLSFHHHFRNGDGVLNQVLAVAASLGRKNLNIMISSIFPVHAPLIDHIRSGVVGGLDTNYISGPVGKALSQGVLANPVIMRTHGGRARAIEAGQAHVDVAFIAAPACDRYGNVSGTMGPAACGSLGYAMPDAEYADHVVAVTDYLVDYPLAPVSIPQTRVDYVVTVEKIGDPKGIVSGTTTITKDPVGLKIAQSAAQVIAASGLLKEGFSFQTGAGGASLAAADYMARIMERRGISGSFAMGGITGYLVNMLDRGLFKRIIDVQDFDLEAVQSLATNPNHLEVSAGYYANPFNSGCVVNMLDTVILGATEIDTDFNVNVTTGSDGIIMGGSGGHSDAAAGAKMTIIVANLLRGRLPILLDKVLTVTTPGETVDVLVTEHGVAVNPRRAELASRLKEAGLPVRDVHDLKTLAEKMAGVPVAPTFDGRIVGLVEYRDGTVIDVVRQTGG